MAKVASNSEKSISSVRGATLLEFLFAVGIFSVVALALFSNINNVMLTSKKNEVAPTVYEKDQVIRYEIVTTMDFFQRELIVNDCPDENDDGILQTSEIKYCTNPMDKLKFSQQKFIFPRAVYWGSKDFLKSEPYVSETISRFDSLTGNLRLAGNVSQKNEFEAALQACENVSFKASTDNIAEKDSYFICGYGDNLLVQVKVNFWDYLTGSLTKCKNLNTKPGRGVQVIYRFYHIRSFEDSGQTMYAITSHSSKLFIPKKVDTNFLPSRNTWDTDETGTDLGNGPGYQEGDPEYFKNCRARPT